VCYIFAIYTRVYREIIITSREAQRVPPSLLEVHHYREILQMHLHTRRHSWTLTLPRGVHVHAPRPFRVWVNARTRESGATSP
jgi:hypothetical protein